MNDEQLDEILRNALHRKREIKEEEILTEETQKEEKTMKNRKIKMAGIAGTVAAALALAAFFHRPRLPSRSKRCFRAIGDSGVN